MHLTQSACTALCRNQAGGAVTCGLRLVAGIMVVLVNLPAEQANASAARDVPTQGMGGFSRIARLDRRASGPPIDLGA
jgi:hypothetical protein